MRHAGSRPCPDAQVTSQENISTFCMSRTATRVVDKSVQRCSRILVQRQSAWWRLPIQVPFCSFAVHRRGIGSLTRIGTFRYHFFVCTITTTILLIRPLPSMDATAHGGGSTTVCCRATMIPQIRRRCWHAHKPHLVVFCYHFVPTKERLIRRGLGRVTGRGVDAVKLRDSRQPAESWYRNWSRSTYGARSQS